MLKLIDVFSVICFSDLCKEYLRVMTISMPFLLRIRTEHFDILNLFLHHHIQELHELLNMVQFFGPHCTYAAQY